MTTEMQEFTPLNNGFNQTFRAGRMSIGLVVPIENYRDTAIPTMEKHLELVQLAEELGFSAVWLRDVPFHVPDFGDVGQIYDPFVYLGFLAAQTSRIALGVSSIVLPLRHPAHVAKSATSVDQLSGGRLLLGVASGDRSEEYPAMGLDHQDRGERFRDSFTYIRQMQRHYPLFKNHFGELQGNIDMLPKATSGAVPMLITGGSQQSPEWIAENGDGWMIYPRQPILQKQIIANWRKQLAARNQKPKPVMQPLYYDMTSNNTDASTPLHLGFRSGTNYLVQYLKTLESIDINHVALNLRFNQADAMTTLRTLAEQVLPEFNNEARHELPKNLQETA